jgi:hypothetical protein
MGVPQQVAFLHHAYESIFVVLQVPGHDLDASGIAQLCWSFSS